MIPTKYIPILTPMVNTAVLMLRMKSAHEQEQYRRDVTVELHLKQVDKAQTTLIGALTPFFAEQLNVITENLRGLNTRSQKDNEDDAADVLIDRVFDPDTFNEELITITLPVLAQASAEATVATLVISGAPDPRRSTATDWLQNLTDDLPPGLSTEFPPWMQNAIEEQLRETFEQEYWLKITQTTRNDIQTILRVGLQEGDSIRVMADRISGLSDGYSRARATNIARTEAGNALNGGRKLGIEKLQADLGPQVPMRASWLSILSTTTRDRHAGLDGVPADSNGMWNLGGHIIPWPRHFSLPASERCNCNCTIVTQFGMQSDEATQLISDFYSRSFEKILVA